MSNNEGKNAAAVRVYKGIEVVLDAEQFKFLIYATISDKDLNGWPRDSVHASYKDAMEAIDKFLAAKATGEKRALALSYNVITDNGQSVVVHGISRRDGNLQVKGYKTRGLEQNRTYKHRVYVARPWVGPLLAERDRLRDAIREIEHQLYRVGIDGNRSYRGGIDAADYARLIQRLEEDFAKAENYAIQHDNELAKLERAEKTEEVA